MNKGTMRKYIKNITIVIVFLTILLINDLFLISKINDDRIKRILELENKMANMQSRINLNVTRIENLD